MRAMIFSFILRRLSFAFAALSVVCACNINQSHFSDKKTTTTTNRHPMSYHVDECSLRHSLRNSTFSQIHFQAWKKKRTNETILKPGNSSISESKTTFTSLVCSSLINNAWKWMKIDESENKKRETKRIYQKWTELMNIARRRRRRRACWWCLIVDFKNTINASKDTILKNDKPNRLSRRRWQSMHEQQDALSNSLVEFNNWSLRVDTEMNGSSEYASDRRTTTQCKAKHRSYLLMVIEHSFIVKKNERRKSKTYETANGGWE